MRIAARTSARRPLHYGRPRLIGACVSLSESVSVCVEENGERRCKISKMRVECRVKPYFTPCTFRYGFTEPSHYFTRKNALTQDLRLPFTLGGTCPYIIIKLLVLYALRFYNNAQMGPRTTAYTPRQRC